MSNGQWPELPETAASIDASLKDNVTVGGAIVDALVSIDAQLALIRRNAFPLEPETQVEGQWPWAPGTQAQGFLTSRWNRRDGNVYGAAPGPTGPNSPIRGGDDSQTAKAARAG